MPDGDSHTDILPAGPAGGPGVRGGAAGPRRAACPECGRVPDGADLVEHLVAAHGYLRISGALLPRAEALTCLWDRVFNGGDRRAHEWLGQLLGSSRDGAGRSDYARALEAELLRRADVLLFRNRKQLGRLVYNLRRHPGARERFAELLRSSDERIRRLGRELLLPDLSGELPGASAADLRARLERLCPADDVWEKIRVCQRLPHYGAPAEAVHQCLEQLRGERPVGCPECGAIVTGAQLERHLRQAHHVYQFRGVVRSLEETAEALLTAVCEASPDFEAWELLLSLARDEYGGAAEEFLAGGLARALERVPESSRDEIFEAVAEVVSASPVGRGLAVRLAQRDAGPARLLALLLTARLPPPFSAELTGVILPLLRRKQAPADVQAAAAAALVRSAGKDEAQGRAVAKALTLRCSKVRAVERLRSVMALAGPVPALVRRCLRIESRIRMRCPKCDLQLRRPEMARHVWSQHLLLLDGRRVRKPWHLIEDWIADYRRGQDPGLLTRCQTLAQYLDPEHGRLRVYRLFLTAGLEHVEAREVLRAEARQRHASLCPACYTLVPLPAPAVPRPLNESHGRLSQGGYCVEVREHGLLPRLRIEAPDKLLYDGREPDRYLTGPAATLLFAGPPVAAALGSAVATHLHAASEWAVAVALGAAGAATYGVRLWQRSRPALIDRAVDHAWSRLAPTLHAEAFRTDDAAFLASLALSSIDRGWPAERADVLDHVLRTTEKAVHAGLCPLAYLAALHRLVTADAVRLGRDPVPGVAAQVGRSLAGRLPLAYAQQLLAEWESPWWTTGNLGRLRVLLCDQAFEAGLEVADLVEAGRLAPALGEVLDVRDRQALARLRLLWSLRAEAPWVRWSQPVTAFELAADPDVGRQLLARYPDLLLVDQGAPAIFLTGRGVVFQEEEFTRPPRTIELRSRKDFDHVRYEVAIDGTVFRFPTDPATLVRRLERWFRYWFGDFLPRVDQVHAWHAPPGTRPVRFEEVVRCPECRRFLLARAGEMGRVVEEGN